MKALEVMVMTVFGGLVLGGMVLAGRQGRRERDQVARFSEARGYPLLDGPDSRMLELLAEATSGEIWRPSSAMLVTRSTPRAFLFRYEARPGDTSSKTVSRGMAVLVEHDGRRPSHPVQIFTRTPGVETLVGGRVEAGSREFREQYTVTCADARTASETLSAAVERILMEHRDGPGWYLSVTLSATAVLVSSFWAQSDGEWDHLIDLGMRLGAAMR